MQNTPAEDFSSATSSPRFQEPGNAFRSSLVSRLIVSLGIILFISIATWAFFNISYQKQKVMKDAMEGAQRLSNTIRLGAHYAMMLNSRDDINQIINNIGTLDEIESIRIYNKKGRIKYSNMPNEVDRVTDIQSEVCVTCHQNEPPVAPLPVAERVRIFKSSEGRRFLGLINPIYNESGCATGECHAHPEGKKILGTLDVVLSLQSADAEILLVEKGIIGLALILFLFNSAFIFFFVVRFVKRPIAKLIRITRRISRGDYSSGLEIDQKDEMGELAEAMNRMMEEIGKNQAELKEQRKRFQDLFEGVPCIITVQDREYRLVGYNKEFSDRFAPTPGDFCYRAYKGRDHKCVICPVEKTFEDGRSHTSEEVGLSKDGTKTYWIVRTAPIRNEKGEVVAAMEMNLDITEQKRLEKKLAASERKYHAIFDNIPNPVFVVDMETLEILNCNDSAMAVYGYEKKEMLGTSFMELFMEAERDAYASRIRGLEPITQVRNKGKNEKRLFINLRISLSEYDGRQVFLMTVSDITQRLETEQQLIHASKMATLGEMATGVAHELNQPLSVIKTASSYFMKKVKKKEPIKEEVLLTMATEIDQHVDRATKIISHMREFGRKSEDNFVQVDVNQTLQRAFEIFSQQLKVRGIEVKWEIQEDLPPIQGDPDRMEQVIINLLINARDAIEEKWNKKEYRPGDKKITLRTRRDDGRVRVEIEDTGAGVPKEMAEKIFEPFFTTKEVGKGTGLGLSISYGIVKDCRGDIRVISEPEKGAKFIIRCPIVKEK